MGEDGRAIALDMLIEPDAGAGLGHDRCERGLTDLKRITPQVIEEESVIKIVSEIVHVNKTPEEIAADGEPMLIEWRGVRDANGSGVLNEDTTRTKR